MYPPSSPFSRGLQSQPLPPDMTSRPRPQTFRELVADLYGHSAGFRSLSRILTLLGCGVA